MTVAEFIERLKELPQDATVVRPRTTDPRDGYVGFDGWRPTLMELARAKSVMSDADYYEKHPFMQDREIVQALILR